MLRPSSYGDLFYLLSHDAITGKIASEVQHICNAGGL